MSSGGKSPGYLDPWGFVEEVAGPECPCCHRADWSHTIGCPVEKYNREWRRIWDERLVEAAP